MFTGCFERKDTNLYRRITTMIYKFYCKTCDKEHELDIPIEKYTDLKDRQKCPSCHRKLERVIEWSGVASGSGDGWFGRSDGSKAI